MALRRDSLRNVRARQPVSAVWRGRYAIMRGIGGLWHRCARLPSRMAARRVAGYDAARARARSLQQRRATTGAPNDPSEEDALFVSTA
ncbi:MAG: hypothetical protein WDN25_14395 [Acetobacteraceae bacterium]